MRSFTNCIQAKYKQNDDAKEVDMASICIIFLFYIILSGVRLRLFGTADTTGLL
jgi:hypothetical protein